MSSELARMQAALDQKSRHFDALAAVASREMPAYVKDEVSTIVSVLMGAAAGAVEGYCKPRVGTAINAGVAVAALAVGWVNKDKPDIREGANAVARGFGAGEAALQTYDATTRWMASRSTPAPAPSAPPAG